MVTLEVEWQEVLDRNWNSEIPLVFAHDLLTDLLGVQRDRYMRARISRRMDLWEEGIS